MSSRVRAGDGTVLTLGSIPDGQYLKRSGTGVVGDTPTAALPPLVTTALSTAGADRSVAAGYGAYVPDQYEIENTRSLEIANGGVLEIG